jgi:hypothetical protein
MPERIKPLGNTLKHYRKLQVSNTFQLPPIFGKQNGKNHIFRWDKECKTLIGGVR